MKHFIGQINGGFADQAADGKIDADLGVLLAAGGVIRLERLAPGVDNILIDTDGVLGFGRYIVLIGCNAGGR